MSTGAWVLAISVVVAIAFGCWRAATDGRFRPRGRSSRSPHSTSRDPLLGGVGRDVVGRERYGERATLLQFSSAFCAPCRATRRVLTEVAEVVPGVTHVELDAEHHLEVVRALGITRTPTTLILDLDGIEVTRAVGAPRKEQVLAALAQTSQR